MLAENSFAVPDIKNIQTSRCQVLDNQLEVLQVLVTDIGPVRNFLRKVNMHRP